MISVHFQGKPFNITVIQVCAPTSNAEEAEWFCEDLQDNFGKIFASILLNLTLASKFYSLYVPYSTFIFVYQNICTSMFTK